jgi:hypothetical protein
MRWIGERERVGEGEERVLRLGLVPAALRAEQLGVLVIEGLLGVRGIVDLRRGPGQRSTRR